MEYFFDNQLRRYLLQFIRIFSDIKIESSPGVLKRVPVKYGDMNRMVANILRENSQNTIMSAPQMSAYITSLELSPDRRNDTMFVRKTRAVERVYDPDTDTYGTEAGNRYSIDSYMPVPYTLNLQLDIWTTNTTDKFQIIEQIMTVFNPSVQIQTTDNVLDWSSIFEVELTGLTWSSRGVPVGPDSANDFASMQFKVPVWISPPAKVTKQRMIKTIITSVFDKAVGAGELRGVADPLRSCFDDLKQFVITPGNLSIKVSEDSQIELLNSEYTWPSLFATYGNFDANSGILVLKTKENIEDSSGDIIGSIELVDDTTLNFMIDTDTLPAVQYAINAIIDPAKSFPGNGLPQAAAGQRYLLIDSSNHAGDTQPIIPESVSWGSLVAFEYDIIEYDGNNWNVIFNSSEEADNQYVTNLDDNQHYKFVDGVWIYTYVGEYNPGYWRIEV